MNRTNEEQGEMQTQAAVKRILGELLEVASEEGRKERERLGRDLTDQEATVLAARIEHQFKIALALTR